MKKLILAALLFSGLGLKAQHDISTDVLGFAFSKYGIGYDYLMNSSNSIGVNINFFMVLSSNLVEIVANNGHPALLSIWRDLDGKWVRRHTQQSTTFP